jgi:hypothetical protein
MQRVKAHMNTEHRTQYNMDIEHAERELEHECRWIHICSASSVNPPIPRYFYVSTMNTKSAQTFTIICENFASTRSAHTY